MNAGKIGFWCVLLALAAGGQVGCNVDPSQGYTLKSQYPSNVRTVSVPIWTRSHRVYRRRLEMRLTEALVKQIENDTPYKVTKKVRADTELTGTIERVTQQVLTINPDNGLPLEMEITLEVSFRWTDLRTGKVLRERSSFRVAGTYVRASPFSESFFHGSEETINRLARRIVEQMQADW